MENIGPIQEIPFWTEDPNILLKQQYITELFPTEGMSFNEKLNSISRTVILVTTIVMIITQNYKVLVSAAITMICIVILFQYRKLKGVEAFGGSDAGAIAPSPNASEMLNKLGVNINSEVFDEPTSNNPFSNVLITDYMKDVQKKPAPPLSNTGVQDAVISNARRLVQEANPGQPDICDKLFSSTNEELNFEQSMRPFHSNPSTTIPNDQGAFAEFCFGGMKSCKEGNLFACARNTSHYNKY